MSPVSTLRSSAEERVSGGVRVRLDLRVAGDTVPAVLLRPTGPTTGAAGTAPAALLLHGYSSRGDVMARGAGEALLRRGVASLAPDLPVHGTRGDPLSLAQTRNPLEVVRLWRLALREAELALGFLGTQPGVNPGQLGVLGYSLGSYLALALAARTGDVRAVVLAAGGDLPNGTPFTAPARALFDPLRAVQNLGGRPLLMESGRHDPVIRPEQAERLYAAAHEPKTLRWWDAGHTLPAAASEDAATWLATRLRGGNGG